MVPFLVAFLLPIFLILIFNVVVYILIIRVIILHTVHKKKRMNMSPLTTTEAIKMLLSYTGIMTLFGLTWLFGVFTFITEPNVSFIVQFFFAFFNTFQGFFIFLFLVLLNGDSRNAWKSLLCPWAVKEERKTSTSFATKHKKFSTSTIQVSSPQEKKAPGNIYESFSEKDRGKEKALPRKSNNSLIFENEVAFEEEEVSTSDEFMTSEFNSIRFDRHLSMRREHYVEKIEIDFFDDDDDEDDDSSGNTEKF